MVGFNRQLKVLNVHKHLPKKKIKEYKKTSSKEQANSRPKLETQQNHFLFWTMHGKKVGQNYNQPSQLHW